MESFLRRPFFVFLGAAERPQEAPDGTLEKQTGKQKLGMKSGKWLLKIVLLCFKLQCLLHERNF
ncbi:hypothetical protein LPBF_03885 [Flavobacterium crassostreae]|uniref:Uncharacterized protein n=1 Tax=Flavobacterium crassostreae TaxID=1763534 RepID=A0A1B9E824_9FLAO|nr:hypothetical protein LPBF_03885 [Flavobacterium crassostreae]